MLFNHLCSMFESLQQRAFETQMLQMHIILFEFNKGMAYLNLFSPIPNFPFNPVICFKTRCYIVSTMNICHMHRETRKNVLQVANTQQDLRSL